MNMGFDIASHMILFCMTGVAGAGKTTLKHSLSSILPEHQYVLYDLDDVGVPPNPDVAWWYQAFNYWLDLAYKNYITAHKITVLCGVASPSHVILCAQHIKNIKIYFGFLKVKDFVLTDRLKLRGWNNILIKNNNQYAPRLESEVQAYINHYIFDCSYDTPMQIAYDVESWMNLCLLKLGVIE